VEDAQLHARPRAFPCRRRWAPSRGRPDISQAVSARRVNPRLQETGSPLRGLLDPHLPWVTTIGPAETCARSLRSRLSIPRSLAGLPA
jgi:hypothetical protein